MTDALGQVLLDSDGVKKPIGTYTFTVTDVTKDGYICAGVVCVMTSGSITVP